MNTDSADFTKLDPALKAYLADVPASGCSDVPVIVGVVAGVTVPEDFDGVSLQRLGPVARTAELSALQLVRLSRQSWVKYIKAIDRLKPVALD